MSGPPGAEAIRATGKGPNSAALAEAPAVSRGVARADTVGKGHSTSGDAVNGRHHPRRHPKTKSALVIAPAAATETQASKRLSLAVALVGLYQMFPLQLST